MANALTSNSGSIFARNGLRWEDAKYRAVLVDMDVAGPVPGARKIAGVANGPQHLPNNPTAPIITTAASHGLSVGDTVSISGVLGSVIPQNEAPSDIPFDYYVRPHVTGIQTGKKYRNARYGPKSVEPLPNNFGWPTVDGRGIVDLVAFWIAEGSNTDHVVNGIHTVAAVPSNTDFILDIAHKNFSYVSGGYVGDLSTDYLGDFVPPHGRVSISDPLENKVILPGGVLDCNEMTFDLPENNNGAEALLIVRTAPSPADNDVIDTEQEIIAYLDTLTGLPVPANTTGPIMWNISNSSNRLMRI